MPSKTCLRFEILSPQNSHENPQEPKPINEKIEFQKNILFSTNKRTKRVEEGSLAFGHVCHPDLDVGHTSAFCKVKTMKQYFMREDALIFI